jgi:soluble lytic murein transglycosylase-like protein
MSLLKYAIAAAVFLAARPAFADLYTFVDEQGVVHFTNVPHDPRYKLVPGTQNTFSAPEAPVVMHRVDINRYDAFIREAATYYSLPFELVKAVVAAESGFEPKAVSPVGAQGLMQLMPATAREMSVSDVFDPKDNIYGGARYLRYLVNLFNGDVRLSVAAYNAGPELVGKRADVPNIEETRTYVKRVMAFYHYYLTGSAQ